jgi:hypothetical protein
MSRSSTALTSMLGCVAAATFAFLATSAGAYTLPAGPQEGGSLAAVMSSGDSAVQTPRPDVLLTLPVLIARHGADDGADHDRGDRRGRGGRDDPAGHADAGFKGDASGAVLLARRGADDPAGDDHGRRGGNRGHGGGGHDDPAGHA